MVGTTGFEPATLCLCIDSGCSRGARDHLVPDEPGGESEDPLVASYFGPEFIFSGSPVCQPRGGGVSPPNFLPLGYIFLFRLSTRPPRPSARLLDRPAPRLHPASPPKPWLYLLSPAQHYHRQTPPLSEPAPDALHALRRADLLRRSMTPPPDSPEYYLDPAEKRQLWKEKEAVEKGEAVRPGDWQAIRATAPRAEA